MVAVVVGAVVVVVFVVASLSPSVAIRWERGEVGGERIAHIQLLNTIPVLFRLTPSNTWCGLGLLSLAQVP